jgi:mono/diheme cytochrome c family protein
MKTRGLTVATTALALFAFGCASYDSSTTNRSQPAAAATPAAAVDELAVANEQFQKNCQTCHGEKGEGGEKKIEGVTLKVPSLREGHALEHSDQQLVKQVLDGGEGMPAFKDKLSTKEAADLVKYIRREFQHEANK